MKFVITFLVLNSPHWTTVQPCLWQFRHSSKLLSPQYAKEVWWVNIQFSSLIYSVEIIKEDSVELSPSLVGSYFIG
jgi:hypothetical protein